MKKHPTLLVIFDGFGYSESHEYNAIAQAKTPCFDQLWQDCPHSLIAGSGVEVGLPDGQMGNSEVGHLNLGAGRVVYQEFTRITKAIQDGEFFQNPVLLEACQQAVKQNKALHLLGLLSPGGVHSHQDHFLAAIELAAQQGVKKLYIHAVLDGRDTAPQSAKASLELVEAKCQELGVGEIASLVGRYYAMDRDNRWERVQAAYELLTEGKAERQFDSALAGLEAAYANSETDEFVKPTLIGEPKLIQDGDAVCFMNFRADRAREITRSFIQQDFTGFERKVWPRLSNYVCLTQYDATFATPVAFPPNKLNNIFAQVVADNDMTQLRIAETEKYAHVTFFFNGGVEQPFKGEDRELIPSPQVATYDLQPEMNAPLLTEKLVAAIKSQQYDFIICNYANADMVGHTGNFAAAVKAVECLDQCLSKVVAALGEVDGELLLTADHGNADCMFNQQTGQAHTAHTSNLVPFIYKGRSATIAKQNGVLADICPTMLYLKGLAIPEEMTGKPLVKLK
jgi:2,3-bisphosphoglycerate-independent phosphoglycerate mutase